MKLLFIIKALSLQGGGAERVLADVAIGLAARGHDIAVASFDPSGSSDFYPYEPPIRRIRMGVHGVDARSGVRAILARAKALRTLVREEAPDVAVPFMHSSYVPLGLALAGSKVPALASEHIVYSHYAPRMVERLLIHGVSRRLDWFTAISEEMRSGFPDNFRNKMTVIPNPVGAVTSAIRADVRGGAEKIVITAGRLEEQKDQKTLVAAFALLADRFPEWRLRIFGEGILRPELEAQIDALGMRGRIALPGVTTDIGAEYACAQLFAMPSAYESFGLVTAEAMAHGLPAVGFADCPGTNELIIDGENGLLVSGPDRPEALAAGLARLMGSEADRVRMGAAGPLRVASFAPERIVERWEALLEQVAQGRAGAL